MLIPSVQVFPSKTLQKWATLPILKSANHFPYEKYKKIEFKLKPFQTIRIFKKTASKRLTKTTTTTTTVAISIAFKVTVLSSPSSKSSSVSSASLSTIATTATTTTAASIPSITLAALQKFLLVLFSTVIKTRSVLMNDIRIKLLYRKIQTSNNKNINNNNNNYKSNNNNNSNGNNNKSNINKGKGNHKSTNYCFKQSVECGGNLASPYAVRKLSNKNNNNHRTYNNSSKSNKVFLHYTPRDPLLWIFNFNQFVLFNKHLAITKSELNITEDLCNYGEVIGGLDIAFNIVADRCYHRNQFYRGNSIQILCVKNQRIKSGVKDNWKSVGDTISNTIDNYYSIGAERIAKVLSGNDEDKSFSFKTWPNLKNICCNFKELFTAVLIV